MSRDNVRVKVDDLIGIEIMLGEQMMLAELIKHLARKAVQGKSGLDVRAYVRKNKWRLRAEALAILRQEGESRQ